MGNFLSIFVMLLMLPLRLGKAEAVPSVGGQSAGGLSLVGEAAVAALPTSAVGRALI